MDEVRSNLSNRNDLIEEFRSFVDLVVDKLIRSMGLPRALRAEFISAGYLGLVEAAERYDKSVCSDFRGFAFLRIRGAVIDSVRAGSEISARAYRILRALEAANDTALDQLLSSGKKSTPEKEKRNLTHALEYLANSALAHRLQKKGPSEPSPGHSSDNPEEELYLKRESARLREIVTSLPDRERTIIEQFYFQGKRFIDIADEEVGLSKSWISRLHSRALTMIREKYEAQTADTI